MGRSDQARRHQVRIAFVIPDAEAASGIILGSARTRTHIWRSMAKAPNRPKRPAAIRPSIRKKTRPSRPAPRRRGRIFRRSTPRWRTLLNPAIGHGRAGRRFADRLSRTRPRARARSTCGGGRGGGSGGEVAASTLRKAPRRCVTLPTPTPAPSPQGGGEAASVRLAAAVGQFIRPPRRFRQAHRARKSTQGLGERPQSAMSPKVPPGARSGSGRCARLWRQRSDRPLTGEPPEGATSLPTFSSRSARSATGRCRSR